MTGSGRPRPLLRAAGWVLVLAFAMLAWSAWTAGDAPDPAQVKRQQLPIREEVDVVATLRLIDRAERQVKRRTGRYTGSVRALAARDRRIGQRARWIGLQLQANRDGQSYLAVARQVDGKFFVAHLIGRTDRDELVRSTGDRKPLTEWTGR